MLLPAAFLSCVVAIGEIVTSPVSGGIPRTEWQTYGTGFFYGFMIKDDVDQKNRRYQIYLVTARHVVANRKNLKVRINSTSKMPGREFEVPSDPPAGQGTWFFHPDPSVDIAAVQIDYNTLVDQKYAVHFFTQDTNALRKSELIEKTISAGDGVFVLGFPMNLAGAQRNYVIVRQGIIARISEMLDNASQTFMIDAFVFPGNSGGPVVSRPEIASIEGSQAYNSAALIGVVTQSRNYIDTAISPQTGRPRITFEENAGLAEILPIDYVDAAIAAHRKFTGEPDLIRRGESEK